MHAVQCSAVQWEGLGLDLIIRSAAKFDNDRLDLDLETRSTIVLDLHCCVL